MRRKYEYEDYIYEVSEKFLVKKMSYLLYTETEYMENSKNKQDGVKFVGLGTKEITDVYSFLSFHKGTRWIKLSKLNKTEEKMGCDFKFIRKVNNHTETWYAYSISDLGFKADARKLFLDICKKENKAVLYKGQKRKVSFPNFETKITIKLSHNHLLVLDEIWDKIKSPSSTTEVNRSGCVKYLIDNFSKRII